MSVKNIFLKIIKYAFLIGLVSVNSRAFASDIKKCPRNFPATGVYIMQLDNNHLEIRVTKDRYLENAHNNESLGEYIGVLKIDLLEELQKFMGTTINKTTTKYGGTKFTEKFDNSWNAMKKSIAAMKILGTCIKNDRIYMSGEWSTQSLIRVKKILEFDEVWDELTMLAIEDPKFDLELEKNPKIFDIKDPKILKDIMDNWRKNRRF